MENGGLNVLSLFDGMACGRIALREAGIKVNKYFASEIDKFAIQQTQHNFPDTVQLGSVTGVRAVDLPRIDLLIGGSPCQGFSFAGHAPAVLTPDAVLRRLTPTECSRLQTIPDWYEWVCSDSQAYRMLGNGWTVDYEASLYVGFIPKKTK